MGVTESNVSDFLMFMGFLLPFLVLLGGLLLTIAALFVLGKRNLADTACAIWAVLILSLPIVGPLAFFIVRPGRTHSDAYE